ncbi:MAG: GtrA family protein [Microbacteriaceae bacterium]
MADLDKLSAERGTSPAEGTARSSNSKLRRAALYTLFAGIALLLNLGAQWLVLHWYPGPYRVVVAIVAGTLIGLPVKYLLDKRFIFRFESKSLREGSKVFVRYTLFSGLTTLIFWGAEFLFELLWHNANLTLLGGALGLVVGYLVKYHLDKRYVFGQESAAITAAETEEGLS